jgi:mRNA-degrading endonuclease RelE of RelBE toxin-antitoxin system
VEIQFIPESVKDYKSLDGSIKKQVNEKIDNLKEDAYIGGRIRK